MTVGYLFSDALETIKGGFATAGTVIEWAFGLGLLAWTANRVRVMRREKKLVAPPSISVAEASERLAATAALVFDVRSHGYYDPGSFRIQGSLRLDPHTVLENLGDFPQDKEILLYCT
jgi:hypothetical protein